MSTPAILFSVFIGLTAIERLIEVRVSNRMHSGALIKAARSMDNPITLLWSSFTPFFYSPASVKSGYRRPVYPCIGDPSPADCDCMPRTQVVVHHNLGSAVEHSGHRRPKPASSHWGALSFHQSPQLCGGRTRRFGTASDSFCSHHCNLIHTS